MPVNIIITAILCFMFIDGRLSRIEGIILLAGMAAYITCMIISALKNREEAEDCKIMPLPKSLLYIAGGLIAVIFGGNLVVDKACIIAANFGVSQNFIGLTIVAIGTSLPELVTSIVATRKGDSGLALGNAIGSNIFNILFILGMSAAIQPLHVLSESLIDCVILLASGIVLFLFAYTKKTMSRLEGAACILMYVGYTAYLAIFNKGFYPLICCTSILAQSYSLTVTNGVAGCSQTVTKDITVKTKPAVSISGNSSVCLGESLTLTANGTGTFVWDDGTV
jgi:cation:H+ antiporter